MVTSLLHGVSSKDMEVSKNLDGLNLILPGCFHYLTPGSKTYFDDNAFQNDEIVDSEAQVLRKRHDNESFAVQNPNTLTDGRNTSSACAHRNLKGYTTLYELRRKTAEFRKGYINWRQFKPKGARGEASDVFTSHTPTQEEVVPQTRVSVLHQQFPPTLEPHRGGNLSTPSPLINIYTLHPRAEISKVDVKEPKKDSYTEAQPKRFAEVSASSPTLLACPRGKGSEQKETAVDTHTRGGVLLDSQEDHGTNEEVDTWLRFYYNPFTPAQEETLLAVNTANLRYFANSRYRQVRVPNYNRDPATVTRWIMHIGVGQFHRAHQLVYMDEYLAQQYESMKIPQTPTSGILEHSYDEVHEKEKGDFEIHKVGPVDTTLNGNRRSKLESVVQEKWGYCGVGLTPYDKKMRDALRQQDLLFTVLERNNKRSAARIIGSMFDYILAYKDPKRALNLLISPELRIVSLTITEKGYCQDVTGQLDLSHPWIFHDIGLLKNNPYSSPACPKSAIGFIVWGLHERYKRLRDPFTVLSCDNLPQNGHVRFSLTHCIIFLGFTPSILYFSST